MANQIKNKSIFISIIDYPVYVVVQATRDEIRFMNFSFLEGGEMHLDTLVPNCSMQKRDNN